MAHPGPGLSQLRRPAWRHRHRPGPGGRARHPRPQPPSGWRRPPTAPAGPALARATTRSPGSPTSVARRAAQRSARSTTATAASATVCPAHAALDDVPVARAPSPRESDQNRAVSGAQPRGRWDSPGRPCSPPHGSRGAEWHQCFLCALSPTVTYLGLGKLCGRTGERQEAQKHLGKALAMYREMDMGFWREQAETEINTFTEETS